jgi:cytochrome c-type biogenesis protein CcmH
MTAFVAVAVAAALLLLAMAAVVFGPRLQRGKSDVSRAAANAQVLCQQLGELEREHARGVLDEAEFARARDELQRRLIADIAGPPQQARPVSRGSPRAVLFAVAGALPLAAVGLYAFVGQPHLVVSPQQALHTAAESAVGADTWLARLEAQVAAEPNDARAWVMLARARMQRDQFEPAAFAYARALEGSAKVARDPLVWCEYADALGMAAGGRLAGRPRELIDRALALDPTHPRALEMAGSAAYEANDFRAAARYWQQLLTLLPSDSAEHAQLAAAITRAERRAQFTLPAS